MLPQTPTHTTTNLAYFHLYTNPCKHTFRYSTHAHTHTHTYTHTHIHTHTSTNSRRTHPQGGNSALVMNGDGVFYIFQTDGCLHIQEPIVHHNIKIHNFSHGTQERKKNAKHIGQGGGGGYRLGSVMWTEVR